MSVVSMSSSRSLPETELDQVVQLAVTLSGPVGPRPPRGHRPGDCGDPRSRRRGDARRYLPARRVHRVGRGGARVPRRRAPRTRPTAEPDAGLEPWLIERLARGELVAISRPDELPREAIAAREQTRRRRAVPCWACRHVLAGQVICALVIDSARWPRRWPQPLVERLQLLSEILGAALQRRRHEHALRSNVAVIEQAERPARGGQRVSERRDQELSRLRRHRRRERGAPTRAGAPGAGRADELERAAAGPDRHRQGTVRAGRARAEPAACAPAGARQLRRAAADARRKRAVRP